MTIVIVQTDAGTGANYGIGTFINEYIYCLKQMCMFDIVLVKVHSLEKEFSIKSENGITVIYVPFVGGGYSYPEKYFKGVSQLLRLHLNSQEQMIFNFQAASLCPLIKYIREDFKDSNLVYTIHYMQDVINLNGDIKLYKNIVSRRNHKSIRNKYSNILTIHDGAKDVFDNVDSIICLSKDTVDTLTNIYSVSHEKIWLIPNGLRDAYKTISDTQN